MNTIIANKVLKKELTCRLINTYSVTQFCKAVGITRSVFYRRYIDMPDMFSDVIQHDIRQHFHDYRHYGIEQVIFAFLKQIYQARLFYINIYHLVSKNRSRHICQEICNTLFHEMQNHLFSSNYSNIYIKGLTAVLFSHIIDWIIHEYDKNVLDIYNEVRFMLPKNV